MNATNFKTIETNLRLSETKVQNFEILLKLFNNVLL